MERSGVVTWEDLKESIREAIESVNPEISTGGLERPDLVADVTDESRITANTDHES